MPQTPNRLLKMLSRNARCATITACKRSLPNTHSNRQREIQWLKRLKNSMLNSSKMYSKHKHNNKLTRVQMHWHPPAPMQSRVNLNLLWLFSYSSICPKAKSANCLPTHTSDVKCAPSKKRSNLISSFTGLFHSSN